MEKRLSKETTERIEGCGITTNTQLNLKESITDVLGSMTEEGWDYEDVKDYLFDLIDDIVKARERDEKGALARMHLIGRQVVIIDETHKQNNVSVKTISDFELEGMIWFEEDEHGTHFIREFDIKVFLQGRKVFIHYGEVSMQLVNSASKTL
jgi:hypothetical protein